MGRRIGRPRAGQEVLTRERILDSALQLVDKRGVDKLSMRRLATELGVDPMAIYHHLPNKRAILTGLVEIVFDKLHVPLIEVDAWPEQVRSFARAYHRLASAHPNLVLYLITDAEAGAKAALAATETLYATLAVAGLRPKMIVRTADLIVDYLNGYVLAEQSGRFGQPGERQELLTLLDQSPPDRFPTIRRVFGSLSEVEIMADFEAGLDIILAGVEVMVRAE